MELMGVKTWLDRHAGGVVELEDDVLSIVQQVKALDPRLHIFYNEQSEEFDVVEHCLDGNQRLVFSVVALDARVLHRLMKADHWGGNDTPERYIRPDDEDFVAVIDADNEDLEVEQYEEFRQKLGDAGERLAWALDLAGVGVKDSILVPKDVSRDSNIRHSEPDAGPGAGSG